MLKSSAPVQEQEEDPLAYYENHTSQIEVGPGGVMGRGRQWGGASAGAGPRLGCDQAPRLSRSCGRTAAWSRSCSPCRASASS